MDIRHTTSRRCFCALTLGGVGSLPVFGLAAGGASPLISSISRETLFRNRDGKGTTWFHPRACMLPGGTALMTLQPISGSDYFGPVHYSTSTDLGKSWTTPAPVDALGRIPEPGHEGLEAGVCDVVPQHHPQSDTTLAMGHVVFYRGPRFSKKDQLPRYPVYAVRKKDGNWGPRKILEWNDPRGGFIYTNNCGQRVVKPDGDIAMSFTFGPASDARSVAGVLCSFDGETLTIKQVGNELVNQVGRGFLEPSVTHFDNRYWMTIRAEDERGHVAVSEDGLHYSEPDPWKWDDGEPLTMSTTQQHWLTHSEGLFLVYTRKDDTNTAVTRWRAPLFVAQVDPERRCLLRETEQIAIPLHGDGVNNPDKVPLMGNFHITRASDTESWITVGEWLPRDGAKGDTHLARVNWSVPDQE